MNTTQLDIRTLERILRDQKAEKENWCHRALCPRAEECLIDLHSPQAQVVIGVRRSGKSTLCMQTLRQAGVNFAYVNFDDERLATIGDEQLNDLLEVIYKIYGHFDYIFLDEIQNINRWPLFVNRLLRTQMHVVLTGSNAKLLSNDLATHLTGRSSEIALYPFSFAEYCFMKGVDCRNRTTQGIAAVRQLFDTYMSEGGFPELLQVKDGKRYITNLVNNILKRDIEQRYKIAFTAQFENMAQHVLNISPCIVSTKDLATLFNFKSPHTVQNYIGHLKEAYLLTGIRKYSSKSKQRMVGEKLYAIDVTMMNRRDNAMAGENLGWRLETIVLSHLMRLCKREGWDVYYLNDRSGECDFVVCHGHRVLQCIQVSYDITSPKTRQREIAGLLLAHKQTHCTDLLLLTDHHEEDVEKNGHVIRIRPVYAWCAELAESAAQTI